MQHQDGGTTATGRKFSAYDRCVTQTVENYLRKSVVRSGFQVLLNISADVRITVYVSWMAKVR
jgi:hypothetical protein